MSAKEFILVKGARQNNLKGIDVKIALGEMTVITGVSGSGKSSLAFDTIYSEGQRRYVETFSPYARQFLDRMDKPRTDRIEGIPPAIAIDQTNPVRTSRSTVGTMTEINDHLKLLFARAATPHCSGCGRIVRRDNAESIFEDLYKQRAAIKSKTEMLLISFVVAVPENFNAMEVKELILRQGYTRLLREEADEVEVVQDRVTFAPSNRGRIVESLEAALEMGGGRLTVYSLENDGANHSPLRYSTDLHCPDCDVHFADPVPGLFSFNSPVGACETCRGFGRTIGIDSDLVVPDGSKTLAGGAVKPWQSKAGAECMEDLLAYAAGKGIPVDVPWKTLSEKEKRWVLEGEGKWEDGVWYGVKGFFDWLETKAYRMHVRVFLSRYRMYSTCPDCRGARLKPEALLWRLGKEGFDIHQVQVLPIVRCREFFDGLKLPGALDEATALLLREIRTRIKYLVEVGLDYLTLDRQSRTLSGGEVQRINLTTALGTSLVNTLFVLDEPSIGLHHRDIKKLVAILHRLRNAGNTLLVVEHDPELIRAADRVIDMGPGPGDRGGKIVFSGTADELLGARRSLTAQYLSGRVRISTGTSCREISSGTKIAALTIRGAEANNLKGIDVAIPLGSLVCITGVSGSGKSTLVEDVLYRGLTRLKGKPAEQAGEHKSIRGSEFVEDVVLVDQSPIGRTARSNPASYVGALNEIRKLFAAEPLARERGYTAGTFSFNSGSGRCPACGGKGFEQVEMQFLSDVYISCPDCSGSRYRPELLEVRLRGTTSIADVLEMTAYEAAAFFSSHKPIVKAIDPLRAIGLGYLRLGQPVPTLSGGEAQRLKLAGHLVKARRGRGNRDGGTLFLLDEPTTGLHFSDIAVLLGALRKLLAEGHSLVVIEHNLDVVAAADWIIDMGPEGGERGGRIVCEGRPKEIAACKESWTGKALRAMRRGTKGKGKGKRRGKRSLPGKNNKVITISRAREHNLKGVNITIPRDRFTVITGVSGSGKSTVAFDILFREGQRRYLESINAYARQFVQPAARPEVDAVSGVPPTVAIEQRTSRGGRKSTVATVTEIYHFLRLLFVRLGVQHCPDCGVPIEQQTLHAVTSQLMRRYRGRRVSILAPMVSARKGYYTDLARWAASKGIENLRVDGELTPTVPWPRLDRFREHDIELPVGEVKVSPSLEGTLLDLLRRAEGFGQGVIHVLPVSSSKEVVYSTRRACTGCNRSFPEPDPRLFSFNSRHGWCEACFGTGLSMAGFDEDQSGEESKWNDWHNRFEHPCPACGGARLRPEALSVLFRDRSIAQVSSLSVEGGERFFRTLTLKGREREIARDIVDEVRSRLSFLIEVGLPYLTLDRGAPSLSGGEARRIRLASQLGSNLKGVCYILDEPTIGLHPRDNRMLLDTLERLRDRGNTVVVVEHDEETIRRAEHIIDLGPGAGVKGGRLIAEGSVREITGTERSVTGRFLKNPLKHPFLKKRPVVKGGGGTGEIMVRGAQLHNLRNVSVSFPLARLVCVTGVSGSGKSTLVRDILHRNLQERIGSKRGKGTPPSFHGCSDISGWELIRRALEVDQTPIGRTPRSCPATYVGFWSDIRGLFSSLPAARMKGWGPGRFSFNIGGGRCEACGGQGIKRIGMSFLPDVSVSCEDCKGKRFNSETLSVRYKDKSIADVLAMSVDEGAQFFSAVPAIHHPLRLLQEVGVGYLTMGQQSPTLSGGEAQRVKLVTELAKAKPVPGKPAILYLLDEPTVGLHMADVEKLLRVIHRLVDAGNTVVVVEHNLDVIAEADWIIDMGPEGGQRGGRIVARGTPETVAERGKRSSTAGFLRAFLKERKNDENPGRLSQ